jgi:3-dehydroquinate dehydratase/shikimate dehydrogenase
MSEATLVATLGVPPSARREEFGELPAAVQWLEVQADRVGDPDTDWLRSHFRGSLLYMLRSKDQGGSFEGDGRLRRERLVRASRHYDLVDLETRDLDGGLLDQIPPRQRLISYHGPATTVAGLRAEFEALCRVEARLYRLVSVAAQAGDELAPLELLRSLGRADVVAYAEGPSGSWSRLLASHLGAPVVFGTLADCPPGHGFSVAQLVGDYGLPALRPVRQLFGIVGGRVCHSLSPRLHNAAYRALGLAGLYLPFSVPSVADFWQRVATGGTLAEAGMPLAGFSLAAPHKEAALAAVGAASPIARRAGAANVVARSGRGWQADTADADGVLRPLRARGIGVHSRRAAVVGCGGAGRAAAVALAEEGAAVTLVNRTEDRDRTAAGRLGLPFVPLSRFRPEDCTLLVHATPAGRDGEEPPFAVERLGRDAVVIDFAYGARPTRLVTAVRQRGGVAIEGREVLFHQARRQFQVMTGEEMPGVLVRQLLGLDISKAAAADGP